jgi:hypothetical protein
MTTTTERMRRIIAARQQRKCDVTSCDERVYRLSKFCIIHHRRDRESGHPLAFAVRRKTVEPFLDAAHRFFERNSEHPEAEKALAWLRETTLAASWRRYAPGKGDELELISPWAKYHRSRMADAKDCLAMALAMHAHREADPRAYLSDRHFTLQFAYRTMQESARVVPGIAGSLKFPWRQQGYPPVRPRLALARLINNNIGSFLIRASRHVIRDMARDAKETANTTKEHTAA